MNAGHITDRQRWMVSIAVGTLGFTALVTQTILLREFFAVFSGNEMVIGLVLANWLLLTAAGSYVGRFVSESSLSVEWIVVYLVLLAVFPLLSVFTLHLLHHLLFAPGAMVGFFESYLFSAALLIPFCMLAGYLFTLYARLLGGTHESGEIARVYSVEALGSVIGGLLYGLFAVFFLTTFQSLILLAFAGLTVSFFLARETDRRFLRYLPVAGIVALAILSGWIDLDRVSRQLLFPAQQIVAVRDTPYGSLTVTKEGEQHSFFENGVLLFSTNDPAPVEESVHYAMVQREHPQKVLLVGGGISGTTNEILKYRVEQVDYVELDAALLEFGARFTTSLLDPRIRTVPEDGRLFVRETSERYNVALINVPDPVTARTNRFYSVEFLRELKGKLSPDGVVQVSLLPAADYLGPEARTVSSIVYSTLRSVFAHVLIVPGGRNYYLASDGPLSIDIARRIAALGIPTLYVNRYYIDEGLQASRSKAIEGSLDPGAPVNRDFAPVAYLRQILYWTSYFGISPWIPGMVLMGILAVVAMRFNAVTLGMFTSGFAGTSLELVLVLGFQIVYGYVYQVIGLIITLFMAGLAGGVWIVGRGWVRSGIRSYIMVQLATAVYALCLPLLLLFLRDQAGISWMVHLLFALITTKIAVLIGMQFAIATRIQQGRIGAVASSLYSVDLLGAALGAWIVAAYLLPALGFDRVCTIVALMCTLSAGFAYMNRGRFLVLTAGE